MGINITYIRAKQGLLYLTTVIDLFDRKVIGWTLSHTMKAKDTSIKSFKKALINRPINPSQSLIYHSDRGIQYACAEFVSELTINQSLEVCQEKEIVGIMLWQKVSSKH